MAKKSLEPFNSQMPMAVFNESQGSSAGLFTEVGARPFACLLVLWSEEHCLLTVSQLRY